MFFASKLKVCFL